MEFKRKVKNNKNPFVTVVKTKLPFNETIQNDHANKIQSFDLK